MATDQQQGLPLGREISLEPCEDLPQMKIVVDKLIGQGSFASIYLAHDTATNKKYAIKRVYQDKRYKNRELLILRTLHHPNCIKLSQFFITTTSIGSMAPSIPSSPHPQGTQYLNLITPYYPETLANIMRYYSNIQEYIPLIYVRLFSYQLLRAISYVHSKGVMHRDIKPANVMVDMESNLLALIDFGSSKYYREGETSVSYICSRYYRPPELLLGCVCYGPSVDLWATGCIIAEMLLGHPLFVGESTVDVLCEIFGLLGTPTREDVRAMNVPIANMDMLPILKPLPWRNLFLSHPPDDAIDLVASLLRYRPESRLSARDALNHKFFDRLKSTTTLPGGVPMPDIFDQIDEEAKGTKRR